MRVANEECDDFELTPESRTGITLYFLLAGGTALLGFLGWLLTL